MIQKESLYLITPGDLILNQFNAYFLQISKQYVLRLFADEVELNFVKGNSYKNNPGYALLYNIDKT